MPCAVCRAHGKERRPKSSRPADLGRKSPNRPSPPSCAVDVLCSPPPSPTAPPRRPPSPARCRPACPLPLLLHTAIPTTTAPPPPPRCRIPVAAVLPARAGARAPPRLLPPPPLSALHQQPVVPHLLSLPSTSSALAVASATSSPSPSPSPAPPPARPLHHRQRHQQLLPCTSFIKQDQVRIPLSSFFFSVFNFCSCYIIFALSVRC